MAYVFLGCFITLSILLSLSTCYYRKIFYFLKKTKRQPEKSQPKCKTYDKQRKIERQQRKPNKVNKTSVATVQVFPQHSPQRVLFNNAEDYRHEDEKYQDRYDDQEFGL